MIYPEDLEVRLGFDQVRHHVSDFCLGDLGKNHAANMRFLSSFDELKPILKQTLEALHLKQRSEQIPVSRYENPEAWLNAISIEGSFLEGESLITICSALRVLISTNDFLRKHEEDSPELFKLCLPAQNGRRTLETLTAKIDEDGSVRDSASAELARIRRRLRDEELKVRRVAEQVIRKALQEGWAPEGSNPTIRDGRLVIPVIAEHKRKLKGYIIDQSSTGQTVYIEPGEVIEANNDLRDLELEERREVIRILMDLTSYLRNNLDELRSGYSFIGLLDYIRAKASFASLIEAGLPVLENRQIMKWMGARHPLLFLSLKGKRELIPLSIDLNTENTFLLVSGPNAGGKSVCLKTVGLIQYMLQCGLLVPMHDDSVMGVFKNIFLDIGDQQSIENDLSTYSSHLRNMDFFIRHSGPDSLVLMDELGAGTDPNFGGGIAQAVLEQLVSKKVWGLATTHYYNLKVFASNYHGIRNAAMKFDTRNLLPLFQLEIGQPGSSFALEIARKTGLSGETIQAAERIIGKELTGLETLMKQVADEKLRVTEKDQEIKRKESQLNATLKRYETLSNELESRKKEILNSAKAEASTLLQQTNKEIEKTIRHIKENKAHKQETKKVREGLRELEKKVKPASVGSTKPAGQLKAGDKVRMINGEVTGTILEVNGKNAQVQFGDLRTSVKTEKLIRSDQIEFLKSATTPKGIELHQRQSDFSSFLDVRGKRAEEIIPLLVRFMDDAVLLGQVEVKILHGKGEGVLRKMIRDYLKKQRTVESFADEHADRGGDGITVVRLK